MNILVTGGAGFIGSHVADDYIARGHHVTVLDDLSTGKKANLNPRASFVRADIRSPKLGGIFSRGRFHVVNHHAAQIDVRRSVGDPLLDADINVSGFLRLLELSRRHRVRKVIFAASGGTYYGECRRPARETDAPSPLSPYGVSKLAGEHYLRAFRALHGLDYTVLRYGNVFGPRQDPHGEAGVAAIFCQRMMGGDPVIIFGDGRQQRDYVFVKDVARANVLALTKGDGESINIGTSRGVSVLELFAGLKRVSGYPLNAVHKPARPGELFRSCLDVRKARSVLGWAPERTLAEGLAATFQHIHRALGR